MEHNRDMVSHGSILDGNEYLEVRNLLTSLVVLRHKNIKGLTGAIGKRSFGGSLRSKSKYMNQQEPTYKIDTAIRNTAHGLVCRVSVMGKLIIKEAPVTNFDDKKPEFLDVI